jgi:hypothetical protein
VNRLVTSYDELVNIALVGATVGFFVSITLTIFLTSDTYKLIDLLRAAFLMYV